MTKEEFEKLNDSVGALQEGLGLVSAAYKIDRVFGMDTERWWARWWKERLVDVFAVVIKGASIVISSCCNYSCPFRPVDPSTLLTFSHSPAFKAFEIVCRISFKLIRYGVSTLAVSQLYPSAFWLPTRPHPQSLFLLFLSSRKWVRSLITSNTRTHAEDSENANSNTSTSLHCCPSCAISHLKSPSQPQVPLELYQGQAEPPYPIPTRSMPRIRNLSHSSSSRTLRTTRFSRVPDRLCDPFS